jgi:23S rRNA (cytosine1962-C5)-methyltransferase
MPSKTSTNKPLRNEVRLKVPADAAQVAVSSRAVARLRAGHVWVYRSDVKAAPDAAPGSLVTVTDDRGKPLGTALYSSTSQIALRLISTERVDADDFPALIRSRLSAAIEYRRRVVRDSEGYRVVFSEADFLPGLIVDRYGEIVTYQVLTQAMDASPIRRAVEETIVEELKPASIVERVEPRIRQLEDLPAREDSVVYSRDAEAKTSTKFQMNGLKFQYDAVAGQKTGAFLDQRENYAAAERYSRGRGLDVFCYQGGFALHMNRACESVTAVDSSRPALEMADRNATLNGGREIEFIEANAFQLLRDYSDAGEKYDIIVLDPPAFAKSKSALDTAMKGYKEINLRALKMLKPGGVLVTCSCSFHVGEALFSEMLASAASDAKRQVRVLERRVQSQDHPVLLTVPETLYLKCIIAEIQ